ncbi:hypothetical protein M9H77_30518 [Catharanthus roseus]|uniref:Uncharacterized protein n=1 Tax=Catharanthus roseus TaxID=4058 RepID=A0ACB9ZYD5_CATRO|nr:hypothetical protein M9H77_30518 [Catharanthus roseus]
MNLDADRKNHASMELKLGPMTRARMKKPKASNGNKDNGMVVYMKEALKHKFEEFGARIIEGNNLRVKRAKNGRKSTLPLTVALSIPSTVGFCRTKLGNSHAYRCVFEFKILNRGSSKKEVIPGKEYSPKLQSKWIYIKVASEDVKDLKKGKSSATIEQRVGDNFVGVNSPHHPRHSESISIQGYHDMSVHNPYPFCEVGYQGRPQARDGRRGEQGGRGYYRPHEETPRQEAWRDDNLFEDFEENPNVGQAYYRGYYDSNRNEDNGMVVFVEEALKTMFEEFGGQGKALKLFLMYSITKDHSREQFEGENGRKGILPPMVALPLPSTKFFKKVGDPWRGVESKVTSNVDLHQISNGLNEI